MYQATSGFMALFAIIAFLMGFSDGADPAVVWIFVIGFGLGAWYFYHKHKTIEDDKMYEKDQETNRRLNNIPNYKSSQKYVSANGDITLSIDETNKQITFVSLNDSKNGVYSYRDVLKSEILTDGYSVSSTNRGSQIGGALLGGMLAGGLGALIGGLSGSTTSEDKVKKVELNVVVNDTSNPVYKITFFNVDFSVYKSDPEYKRAYDKTYRCHQLVSVLIRQADEQDKLKEKTKVENAKKEEVNTSIADELRKLADLKNEGIINIEEFEIQKKKLIG